MKTRAILLMTVLLLMLAVAISVFAQQQPVSEETAYVLRSQTINNGGESASGGGFRLGSTIGQANVDVLRGGGYRLTSGFWHPADDVSISNDIFLPSIHGQ